MELLQKYEMAHIEEAKDIASVSVIDPPGIAEKKSFPPRILLTLILTVFAIVVASVYILNRHQWDQVSLNDPRKVLAQEIARSFRTQLHHYLPLGRDTR